MKTTQLKITKDEIDAFEKACDAVDGVYFTEYTDEIAEVMYKYDFNLFYLGAWFNIQKLK